MHKSWRGMGLGLTMIAAGMVFAGSGSCQAAAGSYARLLHEGEEMYNDHLLEVTIVAGGKIQVTFDRPDPALVSADFTISQCGRELSPTISTLTALIGKGSRGWALYFDGKAVYHRLEFDCQ